jgi:hypothetical protein
VTTGHDSTTPNLADSESLLGMLQRGRGKGYLLALKAPPEEVWPLLFECITNDPRVSGLEYRHEYYANLIRATYMDLEVLRSHLSSADEEKGDIILTLDTLALLGGQCGDDHALDILHEYLSCGQEWECVLYDLVRDRSPEVIRDVIEILHDRIASDWDFRTEFDAIIREDWQKYGSFNQKLRSKCRLLLPICEPWKTICRTNEQLAALFEEVGIDFSRPCPPREEPSEPYMASLSLEDLFSQVGDSNHWAFGRALPQKVSITHEAYLLQQVSSEDRFRVMLAFKGLAALGTPAAFQAVTSYIEASEDANGLVRKQACDAFAEMPSSLTLDTARRWFRREEWYLRKAAGLVLERHATPEDIPLLTETLRASKTDCDSDSRFVHAVRAIKLFKGLGYVPELASAFGCAGDAYDRSDAAEAMYATAPDHFRDEYAFECLWDCHWSTRIAGCRAADLSTPGVLSRLRELAADPRDDSGVREAAQARLDELDGRNGNP